jgi:hypothetical protein
MTTTSFDKRDARARIEAAATWVRRDGRPRAFFYSSHRPGLPDWNDHVDAMWAELAAGVPTVNGYSSSVPPAWWPLYKAAIRVEGEEDGVRESLREWARTTGIPPGEIAWVHDGRRLPIIPLGGPESPARPSVQGPPGRWAPETPRSTRSPAVGSVADGSGPTSGRASGASPRTARSPSS